MVPKIEIAEYSIDGRIPFRDWYDRLDAQAAAAVAVAIGRLADGNTSNVKSIGEGAAELKINRGPRLPGLFRVGRQRAGDPPGWRHQAEATERYQRRASSMA
jgi:putative addiction module killer protein